MAAGEMAAPTQRRPVKTPQPDIGFVANLDMVTSSSSAQAVCKVNSMGARGNPGTTKIKATWMPAFATILQLIEWLGLAPTGPPNSCGDAHARHDHHQSERD